MNTKDHIELAQWVVEKALKLGAAQAAVGISESTYVDIEIRERKLEKLEQSSSNSLGLQIYVDQKFSAHSTSVLDKNSLEKLIYDAVASTKYLTKDPFRALVDKKYYPVDLGIDLKLSDAGYENISAEERIKFAREVEESALGASDKIISVTAGYGDSHSRNTVANSNGFSACVNSTSFYSGAEATVRDENGGRPEDSFYASSRFYRDYPEPQILGRKAVERALKKLGQRKIDSGKYAMVVENRAAGRLISLFLSSMSARSIQQKNSFLDGMLDKKIASEKLTVIDDPFIEKASGSRLFDSECIAASKRTMIENGVLKKYYIDNYYGKKLGWEPNSGSTSNLTYAYGSRSLDQMIAEVQKGILITGFIGGNSNVTTGDFSFGIVGQYFENGTIVHAVNEMNISGNALKLWDQLEFVGNDPYPYGSNKIPSFTFSGIDFSGK